MPQDPDNDAPRERQTGPGGRLNPAALIAQHGSAEAAVSALATSVDDLEHEAAKSRARAKALRDLVPPDDALVLTGDAKTAHEAVVKHLTDAGLDSSEKLTAFVEQARKDATRVAQADRAAELARVAEAAGVSADALPAVFTDGETFEIEGEGDDRKVYVKPREGERTDFEAYVDTKKAALKPALYANREEPAPAAPRGVELPAMRSAAPARGSGGQDHKALVDAKLSDPSYHAV